MMNIMANFKRSNFMSKAVSISNLVLQEYHNVMQVTTFVT